MKKIPILKFLEERFSLNEDSAHHSEIEESISRNVEFKGTNLWALIFAIFIASIGLNVNSAAVIIGAMLVSPLMGPIMGLGLGVAINDLELVKKAIKNLLIAVMISLVVSWLYFFISPLHEAQSELLARTTPSIWDVFIALFGGLAGIVGSTRKEKSNVIPGVAIATALMPPLCTAGFGLAIGNWYYFLGALYLFFINSVFICLSTFIIVRYMKLPRKAYPNKSFEKRVMRYMLLLVTITALPSIYLAYKIVGKTIFENNANHFIKNEFKFSNTHVLNKSLRYNNGKPEIDVLLIGEALSQNRRDSLHAKLQSYKLSAAKLLIKEGRYTINEADISQIKESILGTILAGWEEKTKTENSTDKKDTSPFPYIGDELKALYPDIKTYNLSNTVFNNLDSPRKDTIAVFTAIFSPPLPKHGYSKLESWLKSRLKVDTVIINLQAAKK